MLIYIICLFIIWNIIVFLTYGFDKKRAIKEQSRISERTLILMAFLMGGIGAFAGMRYFHHKTKHLSFKILIPISIIFNLMVIGLIIYFKNILLGLFFK